MTASRMRSEVMREERRRGWREATSHVRRHREHVWRLKIEHSFFFVFFFANPLKTLIPEDGRRPDGVDASSCAEGVAEMVRAFLGEVGRA